MEKADLIAKHGFNEALLGISNTKTTDDLTFCLTSSISLLRD